MQIQKPGEVCGSPLAVNKQIQRKVILDKATIYTGLFNRSDIN